MPPPRATRGRPRRATHGRPRRATRAVAPSSRRRSLRLATAAARSHMATAWPRFADGSPSCAGGWFPGYGSPACHHDAPPEGQDHATPPSAALARRPARPGPRPGVRAHPRPARTAQGKARDRHPRRGSPRVQRRDGHHSASATGGGDVPHQRAGGRGDAVRLADTAPFADVDGKHPGPARHGVHQPGRHDPRDRRKHRAGKPGQINSHGPVLATLELAGGITAQLNITVGDKVLQRVFGNAG